MKIEDLNIFVVGDVMLDKYITGGVERISPEAPVPIVKVNEVTHSLGGCGNVVRNLAEIGVNVTCFGAVGVDEDAFIIADEMKSLGVDFIPLTLDFYPTITKTRIIADERKIQMLRIDREDTSLEMVLKLHEELNEFIPRLEKYISNKKFDMVVLSDYAKGMLNYPLVEFIYSQDIDVIADPKPMNFPLCDKAMMVTPNLKEFKEIADSSKSYLINQIPYILITKGKDGMELRDMNKSWQIPAEEVHRVYNVSGAGDTVVSVMATCMSMGISPLKSAKIANGCASYVVTQPGTSVVTKDVFLKYFGRYSDGL